MIEPHTTAPSVPRISLRPRAPLAPAAAAGLLLLCAASRASATEPYSREHYRIVAQHSGRCVDVAGGNHADGATLRQWDCHGGHNQQWRIAPTGDGYYTITSRATGKVIDVRAVARTSGQVIEQWRRLPNQPNQEWRLHTLGSGLYAFTARHSGQAIEITNEDTQNGGRLRQREVATGAWFLPHQTFRLEQISAGANCQPLPSLPVTGSATIVSSAEDQIVVSGAPLPAQVGPLGIRLRTPAAITWWKGVTILDAENNEINVTAQTQDGVHESAHVILPSGHNPATLKLRFSKAKLFGVHTGMYTFCDLRPLVGATATFDWTRD